MLLSPARIQDTAAQARRHEVGGYVGGHHTHGDWNLIVRHIHDILMVPAEKVVKVVKENWLRGWRSKISCTTDDNFNLYVTLNSVDRSQGQHL